MWSSEHAPAVVCFLGRSSIASNSAAETKSTDSANNALHRLSLIVPVTAEEDDLEDEEEDRQVLMTDGNPSFPIVAETNGMIFLNCADHCTKTGSKSEVISGMTKEQTDSFQKGCNKLIFDDFSDEDKFIEFVSSMKKQCKKHAGATSFLEKLEDNKERVCIFYAKNVFACDHIATTQGEGTMS